MSGEQAAAFPCHPATAARARAWVAARLADLKPGPAEPMFVDDVMLIVSEFVTNSVQAGCQQVCVQVSLEDDDVRIAVSDDAPGAPAAQTTGMSDTRGRGLTIVAAVAKTWGVEPLARGKEVWARLSPQPSRDRQPADPS